MSITINERYESREISRTNRAINMTEIYTIEGTGDPKVAQNSGPSFSAQTVIDGITLEVKNKKAARIAPNACKLTVIWETPGGGNISVSSGNLESWEMNLIAGMQHIEVVNKPEDQTNYPESEDVGTVIGMVGDTIEGVDVFAPRASLTIVKYWEADAINTAFLVQIYSTSGKVNSTTFKGWGAGDLLFLGARVRRAEEGLIGVTYEFLGEISRDVSYELLDGTEVTVPKKGWQYIWRKLKKKVAATKDKKEEKGGIKSVHRATVYKGTDFTVLGLSGDLT